MHMTADDAWRRIVGTSDRREFEAAVVRVVAEAGFEQFTYLELHPAEGAPRSYKISNYPDDWIAEYIEREYRLIDPSIVLGQKMLHPLVWPTLEEDPKVADFYRRAKQAGLVSGFTIPNFGPDITVGLLTVSTHKSLAWTTEYLRQHHLFWRTTASAIYTRSLEIGRPIHAAKLTLRQRECLTWSARGKTSWETAQIMDISEATVNFHLRGAIKRLEARNKNQAAIRALSMELILP
jgi:DNA-binding CsgD family transcriptional regulator